MKHISEMPKAPSAANTKVVIPAEVDSLVLKMMAKDPQGRFQTMEEVLQALRRISGAEFHSGKVVSRPSSPITAPRQKIVVKHQPETAPTQPAAWPTWPMLVTVAVAVGALSGYFILRPLWRFSTAEEAAVEAAVSPAPMAPPAEAAQPSAPPAPPLDAADAPDPAAQVSSPALPGSNQGDRGGAASDSEHHPAVNARPRPKRNPDRPPTREEPPAGYKEDPY